MRTTKKGHFKRITDDQLRYWQTAYRELNPFMSPAAICPECGALPKYWRSWWDSDRPYSYDEFKCENSHKWIVSKIWD